MAFLLMFIAAVVFKHIDKNRKIKRIDVYSLSLSLSIRVAIFISAIVVDLYINIFTRFYLLFISHFG